MAHVLAVGENEHPWNPIIGTVSHTGFQGVESIADSVVALVDKTEATFFYNQGHQHIPANLTVLKKSAPFKRTPFSPEILSILNQSTVVVFGLGTGGSLIALELARAGVGELKLCDYDTLEPENTSRHQGDFTDIGRKKATLTAERAAQINPNIKLKLYEENLLDGEHENELAECLDSCSLIVGAMDHLPSSLYLNREAWLKGIPAVWGGCYEEALGGEVFITIPEKNNPCLECLRGGLTQPEHKGEIDYSHARGPEDYQGEPGLHSAVIVVTSIEIQVILGMLLRNTDSKLQDLVETNKNFLLIGGALGSGFYQFKKPFDIFYQPLKGPKSDCNTHRMAREDETEFSDLDAEICTEIPPEFQIHLEEK